MNEALIREKIAQYERFPPKGKLRIITDTTEFMSIGAGDVLELGGAYYFVRGEETEGRFGLDGEPKFWVKKAVDLADGSPKIIKLAFYETFLMQLGEIQIRCRRSPAKETRVLEKMRGHPRFMQGFSVRDSIGNDVRVIDRVIGTRFYEYINNLQMDHETYFHQVFPGVFDQLLACMKAVGQLHEKGELHGDIRNDHIIIDRKSGLFTWIDFDYIYDWAENPYGVDLFGLGNVLLFAAGKGFHNLGDLNACAPEGMKIVSCLKNTDLSLFFKHRIINLGKLFPYIPEPLNHALMHFSYGAEVFYETVGELLEDLEMCRPLLDPTDSHPASTS